MSQSTDSFIKELVLNVRTNHPITIVYTDDPNETINITKAAIPAIRADNDKTFYWSSRNSWTDITARDKSFADLIGKPTVVNVPDNLKKTPLAFTFGSPEELKCKRPIFIMSLFSIQFKKDVMAVMQELRDFDYMVRNGVNSTYRLIIIANKSFEIPDDYDNIFGVVNHNLPVKSELRDVYNKGFIEAYVDNALATAFGGKKEEFSAVKKQFVALEEYAINTLCGLSERQFKLILFKGVSSSAIRDGALVKSIDFDKFKDFLYERKFAEVAKSGVINLMKPIPMEEVGGLNVLKGWVKERRKAFTKEAKERNIKKPKGMVLVGPSGTGKSYVAKATAGVLEFPCIELNLSSIFNKFVGESESNMENVKYQIESMAPCVVFIDEIDKVFAGEGRGSSGDSGVTARILGKLLTWIQETKAELFFIITANRIQNIPAELMRKGRFDEIWCVTFPTAKERLEQFQIHLKKIGQSVKSLSRAVEKTEEFSPAEIEHIVTEANLQSFMEDKPLTEEYLLKQIEATNPLAKAFADDIARMREWAEKHARWASEREHFNFKEEKAGV